MGGLILGFTGSRHGLADAQYQALARLLSRLAPSELHVG